MKIMIALLVVLGAGCRRECTVLVEPGYDEFIRACYVHSESRACDFRAERLGLSRMVCK